MDISNTPPLSPPTRSTPGSAVQGPPIALPIDPRSRIDGESRPRPVSVSPADAAPGPPLRPRRSTRTMLAFLAGAGIAAGSFGLGAALNDNGIETVETVATTPITNTPPADASSEDATPTIVPPIQTTDPVAAVAATLGPSVLQVETNLGQGSGVVYDDGLILTNNHVIEGASSIVVRSAEGRTFSAELLGTDPRNDIAVLSVGSDSGLPVAALATDSDLAVGQLAVAIGSPFSLSQTVTAGIVSALDRPVPNAVGGFNAMLQTDAPINPGNSGGALANAAGEVIGINTSIRTDGSSNGNVGIGFAVPIDTALGVAQRVVNGQSLDPGVLGVQSSGETDNEVGVILGDVVAGGAADEAGLQTGDRVLTIDGAPVTNFGEVVGLVQSKFSGDQIEITVVRGASIDSAEPVTVTATLD